MLRHLTISNYALIDSVSIEFSEGFTVITGETGAGKSIMLGALALILGQRNDTSAIREKDQKCVVEAHFYIGDYHLEELFEQVDVDYDVETVIRREILPSGKSRAFVNDTPVILPFLKELTQRLIDIHSQHQNLLLGDGEFQLMVIDTIAKNELLKINYHSEFEILKKMEQERTALKEINEKQQSDRDYWEFQVRQLREIALLPGEQEELEKELEQLTHVEEIKAALSTGNLLLMDQEFRVIDSLHQVQIEINKVSNFFAEGEELAERLASVNIELKDIAREISDKALGIEYDPLRLKEVHERLDTIYSLQQKHHVTSIKELLDLQIELEEKLSAIDSFDERLDELNQAISVQQEVVVNLATELTKSRQSVFAHIQEMIVQQLRELGMPHARFEISREQPPHLGVRGNDLIQFRFNANKSGSPEDIPKVASGGELSRLMLCIKSLLSSAKGLPSIIFDEIDAGVSGEIADKMGRIMQQMGSDIQVISITHLPQIAGKGQQHFKVFKSDSGTQTVTSIKLLNQEERVREIAGMLSGARTSDAALINARDLLGN